ncbi:MAG TPA: hypothetical protein P5234_02815 [Thermoanaerobaculaceae bacterium]|nr:hypothetical protein [Thermoanaerobaculaceae bacterium]
MCHRKEQRIRAHEILCWLGLGLIRVAEIQAGMTWSRLRALLQRIRFGSSRAAPRSARA